MAKVVITNDELFLNVFKDLTFTAGTTDGFKFDYTPADQKMLLIFQNTGTAAGTVIVKQGNGIQGVVDLETKSIAAGAMTAIRLDSGYFKNVSGDDRGYVIVVPSATTIKACAVQLP